MSSKTKVQNAKAPNGKAGNVKATKTARPFPLNKDEIDILEREAGAYHLLIEAILQNKRLKWAIVDRVLEENNLYITPRAEADAEFARPYPQYAARTEKIEADLAAARSKIRRREQYLMDLVR